MYQDYFDQLDGVVNESMSSIAASHKASIMKEMDRRQQKIKAENLRKQEEAEAKAERKKRRN